MADKNDFLPRLLAGAGGGFIAESLTLPTDVIKVRLQVQNTSAGGDIDAGMIDCGRKIAQREGLPALWKGYTPAILRQVCYSSFTMVLYEPVREVVRAVTSPSSPGPSSGSHEGATPHFALRLLAGGIAGGVSIAVFNPLEVAKTQIQADRANRGSESVRAVFRRVSCTDGLGGLWAGVQPNVLRTFLVNAAELGTYDQAKTELFVPAFGDGLLAHVCSSGIAGFCSACISTPCDVVKTRLMQSAGTRRKPYGGILDAFVKILREEGVGALYKGFLPICVRKLAWCAVFFVTYERIRVVVNET